VVTHEPALAERSGIETLYKFRPYDTVEHREWVRQILVEHRVYFSRSSELNDQDDLRPLLQLRQYPHDDETRRALLTDAEESWARRKVSPEDISKMRQRLLSMPLHDFNKEAMTRAHRRLDEEYWIFSLTTDRDCQRMWIEYADDERGLCIHFHAHERSPFGFSQQVMYRPTRPSTPYPFGDLSEREIAERATLTKTRRWAHESEYRWIRYPDVDYTGTGLRFEGRYAYFDPSALSGITVGRRMSPERVTAVLEIAEQHDPPLPIYQPRP
jgi:hypothetical protein